MQSSKLLHSSSMHRGEHKDSASAPTTPPHSPCPYISTGVSLFRISCCDRYRNTDLSHLRILGDICVNQFWQERFTIISFGMKQNCKQFEYTSAITPSKLDICRDRGVDDAWWGRLRCPCGPHIEASRTRLFAGGICQLFPLDNTSKITILKLRPIGL